MARLSGKALAAFGATGINDAASTDGGHTGTEAVTAFANDFAGLIRTFHGKRAKTLEFLIKEDGYNHLPPPCQYQSNKLEKMIIIIWLTLPPLNHFLMGLE